jgi:hypothetical protein
LRGSRLLLRLRRSTAERCAIYHRDNLPSASIHEEATISTVMPFMSIFNNLVLYDQSKKLNTPDTIVPDLAESWAWDASKNAAHVQAAPGREMARRQAVHREGRAVHVEPADRQG